MASFQPPKKLPARFWSLRLSKEKEKERQKERERQRALRNSSQEVKVLLAQATQLLMNQRLQWMRHLRRHPRLMGALVVDEAVGEGEAGAVPLRKQLPQIMSLLLLPNPRLLRRRKCQHQGRDRRRHEVNF